MMKALRFPIFVHVKLVILFLFIIDGFSMDFLKDISFPLHLTTLAGLGQNTNTFIYMWYIYMYIVFVLCVVLLSRVVLILG